MGNTYNFAVELPTRAQDPSGFYKKGLIEKLTKNYPWLTVAGLDSPYSTNSGRTIRGVDHAGPGSVITFGTAKNHDVNWVERPDYVREKGYTPVYNIVKDWSTVVSRLDAFAQAKKPVYRPVYKTTSVVYTIAGMPVEVFDNFIKIGYNIIPRYPSTSDYYLFSKPEVTKVIVTINGMY